MIRITLAILILIAACFSHTLVVGELSSPLSASYSLDRLVSKVAAAAAVPTELDPVSSRVPMRDTNRFNQHNMKPRDIPMTQTTRIKTSGRGVPNTAANPSQTMARTSIVADTTPAADQQTTQTTNDIMQQQTNAQIDASREKGIDGERTDANVVRDLPVRDIDSRPEAPIVFPESSPSLTLDTESPVGTLPESLLPSSAFDAVVAAAAADSMEAAPPMAELPPHPTTATPLTAEAANTKPIPTPTMAEPIDLTRSTPIQTVASADSTPVDLPPSPIRPVRPISSPAASQPQPTTKITKKPRAVIKGGVIKQIEQKVVPPAKSASEVNPDSTVAGADPTEPNSPLTLNQGTTDASVDLNTKQRDKALPNRLRVKDKDQAALHLSSKSKPANDTQVPPTILINSTIVVTDPTATTDAATIVSPPEPEAGVEKKNVPVKSTHPDRPRLDLSHVDGDRDVLLRDVRSQPTVTTGGSWLSALLTPMYGAVLFLLVFTLSCMKRVIQVCRGDIGHRDAAAFMSQLTNLGWAKKGNFGFDSPVSTDRTRELASLSFEDGRSRRRGVKAGLGTKANVQAGDIELQSLTASLASLHIPKMIYLDSPHGGDSTPDGNSPMLATCVLTPARLQLLLPYLPATSHIQDLALKYSLGVCGASINDLYRRCGKMQDAITVIQDSAGYIFGCYVSAPWRMHDTYYGNGDSFVFTLHPTFHVYPSSQCNSFYQLATKDSIAIGGGDHFAIWLDDAFRKGQSKPCQTFNSPTLSSDEEFRCHELEVWSFVDGHW